MSKGNKVTFYMKSGNCFTVTLESCSWKSDSSSLTEIKWVNQGQKHLNHIDLDQVEAIVSEGVEE